MECNKDEAIRAKQIAENKLAKGDYKGAHKIAFKAQHLYPDVDNISQLLAVCHVHSVAETKLFGSEMDWYGILQVERFANNGIVKKQYKKFALLLHPDKNMIAEAEAAFKLVGEANWILTEETERAAYDMRIVEPEFSEPEPEPKPEPKRRQGKKKPNKSESESEPEPKRRQEKRKPNRKHKKKSYSGNDRNESMFCGLFETENSDGV